MGRPCDDRLMWEAHRKKDEPIEEGILDRLKARGAGLRGGLKGVGQRIAGTAKGAVAGVKGDIGGVQAAQQQRDDQHDGLHAHEARAGHNIFSRHRLEIALLDPDERDPGCRP